MLALVAGFLCSLAAEAAPAAAAPAVSPVIWEAKLPDFSDGTYAVQVEKMIAQFEASVGQKLRPVKRAKWDLKSTPIPVRAWPRRLV